MWETQVNHNSNNAQKYNEKDEDQGRVLFEIWNNNNITRNIWSEKNNKK